ncbi:N-acetylmuramoyl-L-alanine amidase family protein [Halobacillus seohaensis]|uniref:N-acetylmuramoyl-L-alanine amidase n=1 Tax=Halobacillus seohaensis TaxID=447421 RepID=A0ABW2EKY2_9BACI
MMAYLIALDDGHGKNTSGKRTPYIDHLGHSIRENEFNKQVVKYLDTELKRNGFDTLLVAPTDVDTSLSKRTKRANNAGADAYVSIHYNAYDGSFTGSNPSGIELYVYPGNLNRKAGKLAYHIGSYLRKGTKQNYRGVKEANFQVLRETNMAAVLSENGFMDHPDEAMLMMDAEFQQEVAIEHAKGICDFFNVLYVREQSEAWFIGRRVESIFDGELRFYNQPSWSDTDVVGYLKKGYGFPEITARVPVGGGDQYKAVNSSGAVFYVTTSEKYVQVI